MANQKQNDIKSLLGVIAVNKQIFAKSIRITLFMVLATIILNRLVDHLGRYFFSKGEILIWFGAVSLWLVISGGILLIKGNYLNIVFIPVVILSFKVLEVWFIVSKMLAINYGYQIFQNFEFIPKSTTAFITDFYGGFTLLYGVVISFVLTKSWEQFDNVNRVFDREADVVKLLYSYAFFLREKSQVFTKEIVVVLRKYVLHVINNYRYETKSLGSEKRNGDMILEELRERLKSLIRIGGMRTKESEYFIPELLFRLYDLVDIRGDRITLAGGSPFSSLRIVALLTTLIFLLPFYFIGFTVQSGFLENFIIACVTLLAILMFMIVEDLDEPFFGTWRISDESWQRILVDMDSSKHKLELENLGKLRRTKPELWRSLGKANSKEVGKKRKPNN